MILYFLVIDLQFFNYIYLIYNFKFISLINSN
jgi:hypothetical protein